MIQVYIEVTALLDILKNLGFIESQLGITQKNDKVLLFIKNNNKDMTIEVGQSVVDDCHFDASFCSFCDEYNKLSWENRDELFLKTNAFKNKVRIIFNLSLHGLYDPCKVTENETLVN